VPRGPVSGPQQEEEMEVVVLVEEEEVAGPGSPAGVLQVEVRVDSPVLDCSVRRLKAILNRVR